MIVIINVTDGNNELVMIRRMVAQVELTPLSLFNTPAKSTSTSASTPLSYDQRVIELTPRSPADSGARGATILMIY